MVGFGLFLFCCCCCCFGGGGDGKLISLSTVVKQGGK